MVNTDITGDKMNNQILEELLKSELKTGKATNPYNMPDDIIEEDSDSIPYMFTLSFQISVAYSMVVVSIFN